MPTTTDLQTTVAEIRRRFAAIRTMDRNVRLGRYDGRNSGGDTTHHTQRVEQLMNVLDRDHHLKLMGLLTGEHGLAKRISENRDLGNPRPELRQRLAATRREIKAYMEALNA